MTKPDLDRIALLNFGGIGDEILFSPVIHAISEAYPDAHLTLILEARSGRIKELLPQLDYTLEVDVQSHSRIGLFWHLLKLLQGRHFDAVISSGSSPFIPILLALSGIPIRVGFNTGRLSQKLLTAAAPLFRKVYAGEMYFALAETFLAHTGFDYQPKRPVVPRLEIEPSVRQSASELLAQYEHRPPQKRIFIHPGVSRISVTKNILKAWPINYWKELLTELSMRYPEAYIYLTGGPDDDQVIGVLEEYRQILSEPLRSRIINLYGKTTRIKDLAGLFSVADLLISVDSAPLHLAVGLETPVVGIFAPTDEKKLLPQSDRVKAVVRDDLPCRPCLWDVRQTSCSAPVCLEVKISAVLTQIEAILGPPSNPEGLLENITPNTAESPTQQQQEEMSEDVVSNGSNEAVSEAEPLENPKPKATKTKKKPQKAKKSAPKASFADQKEDLLPESNSKGPVSPAPIELSIEETEELIALEVFESSSDYKT